MKYWAMIVFKLTKLYLKFIMKLRNTTISRYAVCFVSDTHIIDRHLIYERFTIDLAHLTLYLNFWCQSINLYLSVFYKKTIQKIIFVPAYSHSFRVDFSSKSIWLELWNGSFKEWYHILLFSYITVCFYPPVFGVPDLSVK